MKQVLVEGCGEEEVRRGSRATAHAKGSLEGGAVFWDTRSQLPFTFQVREKSLYRSDLVHF